MRNLSTIKVDTLIDENDGNLEKGDISLREALTAIKQGGRITFDQSLINQDAGAGKGVISLSLGELIIDKSLTIKGLGADKLTINGSDQSSIFVIDDGNNNKTSDVVIRDLAITDSIVSQGNTITEDSSGIASSENLSIFNSRIENSTNGISSQLGSDTNNSISDIKLLVRNSVISGNLDGIEWNSGNLTVANTEVTDNSIGIYTAYSGNNDIQVFNSKIDNNSTGIESGSDIRIINSSVSNNDIGIRTTYADGGNSNGISDVTIVGSTVANNLVKAQGELGSNIKIFRSTFSGDKSDVNSNGGNGRFSTGDISFIKSTLEGGTLDGFGGDITIKDSVISGSTGDGATGIDVAVRGNSIDFQRSTLSETNGTGLYAYSSIRVKDSVITGSRDSGIQLIPGSYTSFLSASVENSTLSGNGRASSEAGAILVESYNPYFNEDVSYRVRFNNATITGNTGRIAGGVLIKPSNYDSSITVKDTTIAGNAGFDLVSNRVNSLGGNTVGNGDHTAGFNRSNDLVGSSDRPIDPLANIILGRNGKDRLIGTKRSDIIRGQNGSDILIGNNGNDFLLGENGQDQIIGGAGDDLISGGRGNDQLRGGSGQDIFAFQSLQDGIDTISDFATNQDKIDLSSILSDPRYNSAIPFENYIQIGQSDRNSSTISVLDIDRSSAGRDIFRQLALLRNVSAAALDETSFIL